jgi:DNA-binding NarL/FixJ family response regulator
MLSLEPDLQVVGTADNGETAIEHVATLQPDVVLMDLQLPEMDSTEATRILSRQFPQVKILVLSTFDDDLLIVESIVAGAKGYLLKNMPLQDLVQAIRAVQSGYTQLAPGLMDKLLRGLKKSQAIVQNQSQEVLELLTSRERDVLSLISQGLTNREIATQLVIGEGTVKAHVTRLLSRLNLKNRSRLAIYANSMCNVAVKD